MLGVLKNERCMLKSAEKKMDVFIGNEGERLFSSDVNMLLP